MPIFEIQERGFISTMKSVIFLVAVAAIVGVMAVPVTIHTAVRADPDCEHNGVHLNTNGKPAGNGQQCIGIDEPNEPVRDCGHKNSEKDNNDNGVTACVPRGGAEEGD
jgi:hypothetical protein